MDQGSLLLRKQLKGEGAVGRRRASWRGSSNMGCRASAPGLRGSLPRLQGLRAAPLGQAQGGEGG